MSQVSDERRKYSRFAIRRRALIVVNPGAREHQGTLLDLSEGGAMVHLPEVVSVGTMAHLSFDIEPGSHCQSTGTVSRVLGGSTGLTLGIELGVSNAAFTNFLRNLEAARGEERARYLADLKELRIIFG